MTAPIVVASRAIVGVVQAIVALIRFLVTALVTVARGLGSQGMRIALAVLVIVILMVTAGLLGVMGAVFGS